MSTTSYSDLTLREFVGQLAAQTPTPGGGSVAALAGALSAALGQMVCAFSTGKPKYAAVAADVSSATAHLARAQDMFLRLMDEDAAAYEELSAAFKTARDQPGRAERIQQAAALAAAVPLETSALCRRVLATLEHLAKIGNPNLRSDVQAARHLARAGLEGAAANVEVNLEFMEPQAAATLRQQLAQVTQQP